MNKKGFTLVEILAVVAVLGVMVVIALPAALDSFKKSKKSTFLTETQTIARTAIAQYEVDHYNERYHAMYARYNGEPNEHCESLDLSGNTKTNYFVEVGKNTDGEVVIFQYYVSDGEFEYSFETGEMMDPSIITIDDIRIVVELEPGTPAVDVGEIIDSKTRK